MVRPIGWALVVPALVATGLIAAMTRWPGQWPGFSAAEWRVYGGYAQQWRTWTIWWDQISRGDLVYAAGVALWLLIAMWWMMRMMLRWGVIVARRPAWQFCKGDRRVQGILGLLLAISVGGVLAGWPYRMAQHWVRAELGAPAADGIPGAEVARSAAQAIGPGAGLPAPRRCSWARAVIASWD